MKVSIKKLDSSTENWYVCVIETKDGKKGAGYGTTRSKAFRDCMRDLGVIKELAK